MKEAGEKGSAALWAICGMAAVLFMALGLSAVVRYGAQGSQEFILETRLRLAAEGCLERKALEIEENPSAVDSLAEGKWHPWGEEQREDGIRVTLGIRRVSSGRGDEEDIFLRAWGEPAEKPEWSQGKIVCGWLHRKGEDCVWRGWRAVEE